MVKSVYIELVNGKRKEIVENEEFKYFHPYSAKVRSFVINANEIKISLEDDTIVNYPMTNIVSYSIKMRN
ncbi:hypothetical protein [Methanobacterium spitsbergense]|uniref:Uncharacterized protein n=1 Tax=Methanobacterium spitsbergense TaxID=2874285 RepID=A0A8T5V1R4_9EURY|nr:hypothetical protein [Methanobacterium spitsbergense]MBZ2166993.1 hypothetical protein [Methanobacterium spitsbergense]